MRGDKVGLLDSKPDGPDEYALYLYMTPESWNNNYYKIAQSINLGGSIHL